MKFNTWGLFGAVGFLFVMIMNVSTAQAATFPISQNFSGSQPALWELRASSTWNTLVGTSSTLQLTSAGVGQGGLGFLNDSFSSNLGIVAQFRYYAGGGSGADGLTFFLVDGDLVSSSTITTGAFGGALGYAQSNQPHDGIPHAYLGVGFDEFGNFVTNSGGMDAGASSSIPNTVVLRGSGNATTGYNYLTHTNVSSSFGKTIDGGWRIARVTVTPNGGSAAVVRVEMSWDEGATWYVVINNYSYNQAPPTNFKLGFSAGTGGSTNIHAIDDLTVSLPVDLQTAVTVPLAGTYHRGDTVHYTYTVTNRGPNASSDTTIANTMPLGLLGIDNIVWSLTSTHGSTTSGTGSSISAIHLTMPASSTVTINATGTIGANILNTTNLNHTITVTPPAGVVDPSPSNAVASVSFTTSAPTAASSSLLMIIAYATSQGTTTAPTLGDYTTAGVTGVSSSTLTAMNTLLAASTPTTLGDVQTIATLVQSPAIATVAASAITRTTASLSGNAVRLGSTTMTSLNIEYGLTTSYGSSLTTATVAVGTYSLSATALTCGTTYHYRAFVEDGSAHRFYGSDLTFTTTSCSSGGGSSATSISSAVATPVVVTTVTPTTGTTEQKVAALMVQVAALQSALRQMTGGMGGNGSTTVSLTGLTVRDLTGGMKGDDVKALQLLLIAKGYPIAAGPTGYFAGQTKVALSGYQAAHGITPAQGYFGIKTRTEMKAAGLGGLWW